MSAIDFWFFSLRCDDGILCQAEQLLTDAERLRAENFRFERHRRRFIVRRAMRRVLLAHFTGTTPSRLLIDEPDRGKPALRDSDVEFNASHTGDLGVIVTGHGPLGVDVESLERSMDFLRFARHSFTEDEYLDISQSLHDDLPTAFFNCWTAKEAYLKAIGLGLGKALKSFSVQCLPGAEPGLRWDRDSDEASTTWRFDRTSVGSHVATIVTSAEPECPGLSRRCLDITSLREGTPVAGNEDLLPPLR